MLQINNLSIIHKKDLSKIIEDFSFTLNKGDKVVIIGEEGNGKSTLIKMIADEKLVASYTEHSGEIIKQNESIGYLPQELPDEYKTKTVYDFFSMTPQFFELTPGEQAGITKQFGLSPEFLYSDQVIETLSGGEKIKVQFMGLLMKRPTILLLDEPSNDIDIETLEWMEVFINKSPLSIMYVSHDETLIERTATAVIHIERLRRKSIPRCTVARMPYAQYIQERLSRFEHQEQIARKEKSDYERKMEKYRQIESKVEHQQNIVSRQDPHGGQLLKKKMHAVKSMGKRFEREKEGMTQMPEFESSILLKFTSIDGIPKGKNVLNMELSSLNVGKVELAKDIQLNVQGGEKICIIGRNGAGKTTLIRIIADMLLQRKDLNACYMPQNYEDMMPMSITPVDFLCMTGYKDGITKIRVWLGSMKFTADEMGHPISELSSGQRAKLFFLKMNLNGANVLILDEPTRNFSPLSNPVIREVLKEYTGTIISVSHDRRYISEVCSKVYELTPEGLTMFIGLD
jgi:ATPase subunit of ABC transporter with duplicated ATPase domains